MTKKKSPITESRGFLLMIAALFMLYLWYTMPKTVEELYPYLDLSECTGVTVWAPGGETSITTVNEPLSAEDAKPIVELFEGRAFRRTLGSIFPPNVRYHRSEPGEFQWTLTFLFEDVTLPDGSGASGALLQVNNFYGKLDISSNGKTIYNISTADKEAWLQEVMDTIYTIENP